MGQMTTMVVLLAATALCRAKALVDPEAPLPDFFKICKRNDPNLNECIKESMKSILPAIKDGYKPLEIPPIDPLSTPKFHVNHNIGNIKGNVQGKDNKVFGSSNCEIKEVRATVTDDSLEMEIDLMFDNLIFEGNYKFDGGVNLFQIHTKGFFNISMEGVSTTWAVKGELEERDGEKYMVIKEADMSPVPSNVNIYATNIFPDKAVNDAFLVTMNQNWRSLYKEALPILSTLWGPPIKTGMNYVFEKIPFRRLFPES